MITLQKIQEELVILWTKDTYNELFLSGRLPHRDFEHALLHVMKAVGKLSALVEDGDHIRSVPYFPYEEVRKYLADLVICAARMANTAPGGIDLGMAVVDRIEEKMGKQIEK